MRALTRHALVAAAVGSVGLSIWACDAKKQTEYVAGVSTQVQVPRDLKTVRVDINVGGVNVFCRTYKVYDGKVQLPRSLGSFPASGSPTGDPVTVTVVGFTADTEDPNNQDVYQCLTSVRTEDTVDPTTKQVIPANSRILRRSRQPYVKDEILFLPMALKFSCFDKDCETSGQNMTCKGGRCVDAVTDEKSLPKFSDDLVDGTGGACFHASQCFPPTATLPAATVNADDCTYAIPSTPSAPPLAVDAGPLPQIAQQGLNVQIIWDGGYTQEILDKSPDEGFIVPDATKPQQFRLAPGLCDFVKGFDNSTPPKATSHRITGIFASPICQPKGPFQPLCASDALAAMGVDTNGVGPTPAASCISTQLKPPTSLLMVVADDTENSQVFFQSAADLTVKLSLSDPAFDSTKIGLIYTPESADPTCAPFTPTVPLTPARDAKPLFVSSFAAKTSSLVTMDKDVHLDGALSAAYTALESGGDDSIYKRAVFVIGNRQLNTNPGQCTATQSATLASTALSASNPKPVETFVTLLARDFPNKAADDPGPIADANALAQAGSGGTRNAFDARGGNQAVAAQAFQSLVEDIATCVYDVPVALVKPSNDLSYQDPLSPLSGKKVIHFNAGCTALTAGAGSGWGTDVSGDATKTRIFICGSDCTTYRTIRQNAANQAALYLQSPPAVPMFSYDASCTTP